MANTTSTSVATTTLIGTKGVQQGSASSDVFTLIDVIEPGQTVPRTHGRKSKCYRFTVVDSMGRESVRCVPPSWQLCHEFVTSTGEIISMWPNVVDPETGEEVCSLFQGEQVIFIQSWRFDRNGDPIWSRDAEGNLRYRTNPDGSPLTDDAGNRVPYIELLTEIRCAEPDYIQASREWRQTRRQQAQEKWNQYCQRKLAAGEPLFPER